jgi:uncharacterized C2H2 Zn-finger protein
MDIPLDVELKRAEDELAKLRKKDPDAVFHCPICGKYYRNLANYRELKMCGACYVKNKTAEMQRLADSLVGGTVIEVEVEPVDPMMPEADKPTIKKIIVLKDGKKIKLDKPEQMRFIFSATKP